MLILHKAVAAKLNQGFIRFDSRPHEFVDVEHRQWETKILPVATLPPCTPSAV